MRGSAWKGLGAAALMAALSGCATVGGKPGSTMLVNGTNGLDNFNLVGQANWTATDGVIQATEGGKDPACLVSKNIYAEPSNSARSRLSRSNERDRR